MVIVTRSPEETKKLASRIARKLKGGEIIALAGPLGAGKTVFVKGLAKWLGIKEKLVRSPSFVLLAEYRQGRLPLFHFDFYRINNPEEIETTPFADRLKENGIIAIEWPERIAEYLPPRTRWVEIEVLGCKTRRIKIN
ncbi:MAG: tRNA (adenosine(37)-N6)-threonylcarbamoyltransferase complex ATPase subunit type 1 TsaE [Candidatus Omnitrophota bacterium]